MACDTASHVPKQSCSKKLNIAPFVLMTVIARYHQQYDISSSFHVFSFFSQLKAFQILPQSKQKSVTETVVI